MLPGTRCDFWGPGVGLVDSWGSLLTQRILWLCVCVCMCYETSVILMNPDFLVQITWLSNILAITQEKSRILKIQLPLTSIVLVEIHTSSEKNGWQLFCSFLSFHDNCKWIVTPRWGYSFTFFLLVLFLFSDLLIWGAEIWGKVMNLHELTLHILAK